MDKQTAPPEFIEIRRVISDEKTKMNVCSQKELMPLADIQSARAWHKGKNDDYIKGDMTYVLLRPKKKKKEERIATIEDGKVQEKILGNDEKPRSMLIEESYSSFVNRLSHYVPVRRLPEDSNDDTV